MSQSTHEETKEAPPSAPFTITVETHDKSFLEGGAPAVKSMGKTVADVYLTISKRKREGGASTSGIHQNQPT